MAVVRVKIAAVSYLNTVPFVYGINHAETLRAELLLSPPADCAKAFKEGLVDVALVPVATVHQFEDAKIISSYCIGAEKSVRTVTVMSDTSIDKVHTIWLDSHSRTSAMLVKVLAKELWGINPEWRELTDYSIVDNGCPGEGFLLIGDKVFDYERKFKYTYDLADEWRRLTGKPFVFAVWIARQNVAPEVVAAFEEALYLGVERVYEAIMESVHADKPYAYSYLTENIDYLFDNQKHQALELFWEKGMKTDPHANPG